MTKKELKKPLKQNIELKKKLAAKPYMIFKSSKDLIEYRKGCQQ